MYDVEKVRGDFPILSTRINGRPLVYLDNAATSQKPRSVIRAISDYYERSNSNVHRGVHTLSMMASEAYEEARAKVQRFVGAPEVESIIWTRNASESINLVAASWGLSNLKEGDEIVATGMEHHSNLVPWQQLAGRTGAVLKLISVQEGGTLDMESAGEAITERTRLVAVTHLSNVLGTVNPVKDLAARAHSVGAVILVDGAQSVPHMPVDVVDLECDFLAFSAHKMLGPTGVGVLYGRPELLDAMPPYMFGGDMVLRVTYEDARWNQVPYKFEAGTPNIAGAIGTGAAIDYLTALGMESVWAHEQRLTAYALERMRELELVTVMGP
ncbi:MAG: SufS family cysteine desulfurase, partial [Chloroflexi bacterium]|nr:SufS family cysteine desulfurase [Chloroflexota bacterium]